MSTSARPDARVAILLGGGVREALMAQPVLRACEGATVFASPDAVGTLLGLPSVGRALVFDDSPRELWRLFLRLRSGPIETVVVPFPARFKHLVLAYLSGIPRRLTIARLNDWAATERVSTAGRLHPVRDETHRRCLQRDVLPCRSGIERMRAQRLARRVARGR